MILKRMVFVLLGLGGWHITTVLGELTCEMIALQISLRTRSTTTRDRNLQFRGAVSTGFFFFKIFSSGFYFLCSPGLLRNLVRKWPQNGEKIA